MNKTPKWNGANQKRLTDMIGRVTEEEACLAFPKFDPSFVKEKYQALKGNPNPGKKRKADEEGKEDDDHELPPSPVQGMPSSPFFWLLFFKKIFFKKKPLATKKQKQDQMTARTGNMTVQSNAIISDKGLLPFVFEQQGRLYVVWWKQPKLVLKLLFLETEKVIVRVTIPAPTSQDLKGLCPEIPAVKFEERVSTFEVNFPETPLLVQTRETISNETFYGFRATINTVGDGAFFDE